MTTDVRLFVRIRRLWLVSAMLPIANVTACFSPDKAAAFIWWWTEHVTVTEMRIESGRWRRVSW